MTFSEKHKNPCSILQMILLIIYLMTYNVHAQLDTEHYIPPMYGKEDLGSHYLVLGTPVTNTFNVSVTDGAGNLIATVPISSSSSSTILLGDELNSPFLVGQTQLNVPVSNGKGLILTASEPFYASIRVKVSAQAGSLTSKGAKAALGKEFRTGHMFNNNGHIDGKSNVISFMATEDNTTVTVSDINTGVIFQSTATSGSPLTSNDITVSLDKGESYVIAAHLNNPNAGNNMNGVNGTLITSDKDIVVNCGTWLGGNARSGTSPGGAILQGRDIGIDQIVPKENIGDEYVLIKGYGVDNERVVVVAAEDNTQIFLNGSGTPSATLNAGDYHIIDGTAFSSNNNLYLQASAPVFVTQTLNGANGYSDDNERQAGINFLPPVKCTGSKKVTIPDVGFIGTPYISIIAETGATVTVNGNNVGSGQSVPGTTSYVTYQLSGYTGDVVIESDMLVRVALLNLNGNIGAAGYFSGFSKDVNLLATYQNNGQTVNEEIAEGCGVATITIERSSLHASTVETIDIAVQGTATEGVDYNDIPDQVTFAVGQTTISFQVEAFGDGISEGDETVYLELTIAGDVCGADDLEFLIKDVADINVSLDDPIVQCPGEDIMIQSTVSGGVEPYSYNWSTGDISDAIMVNPTVTQTYTLTVTDVCQQDTAYAATVVEVPIYELIIQTTPDTAILCPYTNMVIAAEATGGLAAYDFNWYVNGQHLLNGPVMNISPPTSTQYVVQVTDQCGLTSADTVDIEVLTPLMQLDVSPDIRSCPYDTSTVWVNVNGGLAPFEYYWTHSGETTDQVQVNPGWTTTYTVVVKDACATYEIEGHPKVEVVKPQAAFDILSGTQMEYLPVSFSNNSAGGNFWYWDLGNGQNSSDFAPVTTYNESGNYDVMLVVTNDIGCRDTAIKNIYINPEFYFFAPNAFTPDGNSLNNTFNIAVIGAQQFEIIIYNRWGTQIFQSSNPNSQWDGTFNGQLVDDGIYIYKCNVVGDDGVSREYMGHVSVLK